MSAVSEESLEERVENNGERVSPRNRDYNFHLQEDVYLYASRFATGKTVVDLGSGSGYGCARLAEIGASGVQGLEYSEDAVNFSRQTFPNPKITFIQTDLNLPLFLAERADLVFSSNVFEHLVDTKQALENVLSILKPNGLLFLAVPAIQEDARLDAEIRNRFHTSNFSVQFWVQTLQRCFDSVEVRMQSLLCPFDVYLTLPESERGKVLNELSCFLLVKDSMQYGDMRRMTYAYANVIFLCRKPRATAELGDFRLCPVSHTRRLGFETGPTVGWSGLLKDCDSIREELAFQGWVGGVELLLARQPSALPGGYLGDAGEKSWGRAKLEISVEEEGSVISKRRKTFDLFEIGYSPYQLHWNLYREPVFVGANQKLFITITAIAKQSGDVFTVATGYRSAESQPRLYWRLYELLAPVP